MDGVVNTDTKNNRSDKNRKRIQLAVEKRRKSKRRDASVKHGERHKNRALHAPEEEHREEYNQHKAYAKREYGIVGHLIHFLETLVCSIHGEAHRRRILLASKMLQQRIGTCKDMRYELVVRRRLDELCVDDAVKQNFPSAIRLRRTNQAGLQAIGNCRFRIPFLRDILVFDGILFVFLEERVESPHGFFGESEFLRQVGIKPNTFFFRRIASGACAVRIAQEVNNKRAIFTTKFQLQIIEVVTNILQVLYR